MSPTGPDLGHLDVRIGAPRVGVPTEHLDTREARPPELIEKGPAFLGPRYSGEPVSLAAPGLLRQRLLEDQLGRKDQPTRVDNPRQFAEDLGSGRIQVEESIDESDVDGAGLARYRFSASLAKLDVVQAHGSGGGCCPGEHRFAEIDPEDRARLPGDQKRVETGAAPQVKYVCSRLDLRKAGNAGDTGEGLHRNSRSVGQPLLVVARSDRNLAPDANR